MRIAENPAAAELPPGAVNVGMLLDDNSPRPHRDGIRFHPVRDVPSLSRSFVAGGVRVHIAAYGPGARNALTTPFR